MLRSLVLGLVSLAVPPSRPAGAPTIGQVFHPGLESVWVFEEDGRRIGHHASRYLGSDDQAGTRAHHFQGSLRLSIAQLGDVEMRATADLWTDDHGHPIRFVQQALVGESYSRVDLEPAGKKSKARIVQGPSPRELTVDVDPAACLLANNFISHLEILLALLPPGEDAKVKLFSGNSLQGFDYKLSSKGSFEEDVAGVHRTGNLYEDSLGERLRFADGHLLDIEIKSLKTVIRRTSERMDPVVVTPPEMHGSSTDLEVEEVKIEHDGAVIAGNMTRKKGVAGRLPAVFFISGSGPQDRNGFSSGMDLGTHEILDHLASRGFAVLRVDDRGAGQSSALPQNASFLDLVSDARACLDFLMKRDDIDPKRVVLIGHSEGGETAPMLAAERPAIAAIVLMAPPGRSVIEIIADQNRQALVERGLAGEELEKEMKAVRAFLARLASDAELDPNTLDDDERAALANRAWFQSHARQDPIANVLKVRCPVLILQGEKDFQVSPTLDAGALETALTAARHPDHELHVLAGLDHLLKKVAGPKSEFAEYWKSRPVDRAALELLSGWLEKRLKSETR